MTGRNTRRDARSHAGRGRPPGHPDPVRLAEAVARAWLEVEAGQRPLAQLEGVLAPALLARLAARLRRRGRPRGAAPGGAALSLRVDRPGPHACDVAVAVRAGERVGALVVRVERHRGAWRVVELARPEDGQGTRVTGSLPEARRPHDAFDEVEAEERLAELTASMHRGHPEGTEAAG